jgi:hypothetical protein
VSTNPTDTTAGAFVPFTTTPLVLAGLSQTHATWREGGALAHLSRRRKTPLGTTFAFTLNEAAAVRLTFTQPTSGRRAGRRCVRTTFQSRHAPACTLPTFAGRLSFGAHAGVDSVRFQGRLSRSRRLAPGRYTLVTTAIDSAGAKSAPAKLGFTIVSG